jgi:hypothetical protein
LALVDFYDALMTRDDNKYEDKEDKKQILLRENPDQRELIETLFEKAILV